MSEETAVDTETGTPPAEDVDNDVLEAPSDEPDETTPDDEEVPADETLPDGEKPPDDGEDESWKNFQKKFEHLKSDRDRRAAMGRAYWEKTRFSSSVRKENEKLKAEVAELRKPAEPADDKPAPKHPDIEKLDQRIKSLYDEDQGFQNEYNQTLTKLGEADQKIYKLQGQLEVVTEDDSRHESISNRIQIAETQKQSVLSDLRRISRDRKQANSEMERLLSDRDWAEKFLTSEQQREKNEREAREHDAKEFPQFIDSLVGRVATEVKVPEDPQVRTRLARYVRQGVVADLAKMGDRALESIDFRKLVKSHVDEFVQDFDLEGRMKFAQRSSDKLKVSVRPASPAARPAPAAAKPAIPVSQLPASGLTESMAKARKYLSSRGL